MEDRFRGRETHEGRKVKLKTKRNGGGEVRMVMEGRIEQEGRGNSRVLNRKVETVKKTGTRTGQRGGY